MKTITLRNQAYEIKNASDILVIDLISHITEGVRGRKARMEIADLISCAIPGISSELASYTSEQNFIMSLDIDEIAFIGGCLTVAMLNNRVTRLQLMDVKQKDKARVNEKIKFFADAIVKSENEIENTQLEILLGGVEINTANDKEFQGDFKGFKTTTRTKAVQSTIDPMLVTIANAQETIKTIEAEVQSIEKEITEEVIEPTTDDTSETSDLEITELENRLAQLKVNK